MRRVIASLLVLTAVQSKADVVDEILSSFGNLCPQTMNKITRPGFNELDDFKKLLVKEKDNDKCFSKDSSVLQSLEDKYNNLKGSYSDYFSQQDKITADHAKLNYYLTALKVEQSKDPADQDQDRIDDLKQKIVDMQAQLADDYDALNDLKQHQSKISKITGNFLSDLKLANTTLLNDLPQENREDCAAPVTHFVSSLFSNVFSAASTFVGPEWGIALQGGAVLADDVGRIINERKWTERFNKIDDQRKIVGYSCLSEALSNQYCDLQEKQILIKDYINSNFGDRHPILESQLHSEVSSIADYAKDVQSLITQQNLSFTAIVEQLFQASEGDRSVKVVLSDIENSLQWMTTQKINPWRAVMYQNLLQQVDLLKQLLLEPATAKWSNSDLATQCQNLANRLTFTNPLEQKAYDILNCFNSVINFKSISSSDNQKTIEYSKLLQDLREYLDYAAQIKLTQLAHSDRQADRERVVGTTRNQLLQLLGLEESLNTTSLDAIYDSLDIASASIASQLTGFYHYQRVRIKSLIKRVAKQQSKFDNENKALVDLCFRLLPLVNGRVDDRIVKACKSVEKRSIEYPEVRLRWTDSLVRSKRKFYTSTKKDYQRFCGLRNYYKEVMFKE